jgi:hypothetical protein
VGKKENLRDPYLNYILQGIMDASSSFSTMLKRSVFFAIVLCIFYAAFFPSRTAASEPETQATTLNFFIGLNGIGASGDKRNSQATLSNKTPLTEEREIEVYFDTTEGKHILKTTFPVTYDSQSGLFKGVLLFGHDVASGTYKVTLKTTGYLKQEIPEAVNITQHQEAKIPIPELVAGDLNDDEKLDALDYNVFLDCDYGAIDPLPMTDQQSAFNSAPCQNHKNAKNVDLDDNGIVDSKDYNLFLREL